VRVTRRRFIAREMHLQMQNVFDTQLAHSDSVANARIDVRFACMTSPSRTRGMDEHRSGSWSRASVEQEGSSKIGSAKSISETRFRSLQKKGMGRRLMPAEAQMARRAFFRGVSRLPSELSLPSVAV
jgi:hypothetical protein